jgi:polysaccharide pyruvyl transferase WcaK-like protein
MKIAIMTQPLGKNYGGIMQAWALQQVLKSEGHEVVTIDRQADEKGFFYHFARLGYRSLQKSLGKRKAPINLEKYFPKIFEHTNAFVVQNLSMSEPLDSTEKIKAHFDRENYDVVIVGSDQTWRPMYSPNIGNFFLDFLKNKNIKRIAYASSFGVAEWEFTEEQKKYCAPLAQKFDAVSVREDSGIALCRNYLGVDATHVLDPTLLLERSAYERLFENENIPKNSGVYTYILDKANWKCQVIETVKEELNLKDFSHQPKDQWSDPMFGDWSQCHMPSVNGWIKGFADADFVITDSFHGTVFSIIFGKPFISLVNDGRGASRFISLLHDLDFSDRLIRGLNKKHILKLLENKYEVESIDKVLSLKKSASRFFLKSHIEY